MKTRHSQSPEREAGNAIICLPAASETNNVSGLNAFSLFQRTGRGMAKLRTKRKVFDRRKFHPCGPSIRNANTASSPTGVVSDFCL